MDQALYIPRLFSYYFGDSAASAYRGASRRLKKWSRAFEQWMDERRRVYKIDTVKQATLAWRRLVKQCGKMPWEVRQADIEQHRAWMEQEGFAASTINCTMGIMASFYQWCDERRVGTMCGGGVYPAREAARIKMRGYAGACLWGRKEGGGVLEVR